MRCLAFCTLVVSIVVVAILATGQDCEIGDDGTCINVDSCVDNHEKCELWMSTGECESNPPYMLLQCRKSCGTCGITDRLELDALIEKKVALHEVGGDETLLETPYGVTQTLDVKTQAGIKEVIKNFTSYMDSVVFKDPRYETVKKTCRNRHRDCAFWAHLGECENNPDYMLKHCAPCCGTCHMLDLNFRCPLNQTEPNALQPGDLNRMFERIVNDAYYQKFEPLVKSMPNPTDAQKAIGVIDGPWVVVLDNFLSPEECERLIELGAIEGYKPSADVGKKNFDGTYASSVNSGRTSTNAWCSSTCYTDEITKQVNSRIENLTGIPEPNAEYLQLLRYEQGQFYQTHHDYIPHHLDRQMGVRTLTVFLYLNDVHHGGGTEFPLLGFTVQPKQGRAVIWPSVLNDNPNAADTRTDHGALPVLEGIKYGANAWIHQKDFKATMAAGCL